MKYTYVHVHEFALRPIAETLAGSKANNHSQLLHIR